MINPDFPLPKRMRILFYKLDCLTVITSAVLSIQCGREPHVTFTSVTASQVDTITIPTEVRVHRALIHIFEREKTDV